MKNLLLLCIAVLIYNICIAQKNYFIECSTNALRVTQDNSYVYTHYANTHSNNYYSNGNEKHNYQNRKINTINQFGVGLSNKNAQCTIGLMLLSTQTSLISNSLNFNFETGPRTYDSSFDNLLNNFSSNNIGIYINAERKIKFHNFNYSFGFQLQASHINSLENIAFWFKGEQRNNVYIKHNAFTSNISPPEININTFASAKISYPIKKFEVSLALLYGLELRYLYGHTIYNTYQTDVASGDIYGAYYTNTKINFLMASFNYLPQFGIKYFLNKKS
jgi:hypothetical protein